jgi:non-ribosomal peptide synthetase-like protein
VTETRAWLSERWAEQLGPLPISADSDFFELGGTSVAAAKLVSILRNRFPSVAVADVYNHRRLGELATRLDELGEARDETVAAPTARRHRGRALQLAGVFLLLATAAPAWLVGVFAYNDWRGAGPRVAWPWLILAWLIFVSAPGRAMAVVSLRRALLRGLKPGRYPRRSWLALRVWFVERLAEQLHVNRLAGTPWAARMARLAGADVGANVQLGTLPSPAALIRIGDSATLEADVDAHGWWIDGSELVIDELRIGAGARVGARSVLMPGAEIGAGAEIEPGSVVTTAVPAGQRWSGSPARQVGKAGDAWPADAPAPARGRLVSKVMFGAALTLLSLVPLLAAVPALVLLDALGGNWQHVGSTFLVMVTSAPLVAAAFVISEALLIALLVRGASRQLRPGWFGEEGGTACALWLCAQLKEVSRGALFPLYASVYTRPWLRLMGLKIGRRTEVSIADGLNPLVTLGDTSFVADAPMFAAGRARNGWLNLAPIEVGNRTFVGNGAVLTGGTKLGNDCLVGIESNAPVQSAHGTSWFGAPPLELPRVPDRTDPSRTTDPPPRLVLARGATELVRILLPNAVSVVLAALELLALESIAQTAGAWTMMVATPLALACGAVGAALVTVMLKWLLIGRYRRGERPFWSSFVWRDEIINSCQELLAGGWLLNSALGSPLMSPYLRAMGARVGKDVWCETLAITEFDLVTIGDGCAINRGACLETHLVHDRLMRLGPAELGAGSTLGPSSATLPDTVLGAGTSVGARSVVLRGEELPAGTRWHGVPVVRA